MKDCPACEAGMPARLRYPIGPKLQFADLVVDIGGQTLITPEKKEQLLRVATTIQDLRDRQYAEDFCYMVLRGALENESVEDFVNEYAASLRVRRDEIVVSLVELLDDLEHPSHIIQRTDVAAIREANRIRKGVLAKLVQTHGGVAKVAQLSGIPDVYLEVMLDGDGILRRRLVAQLVTALDFSVVDHVFEWMAQ